MLAGRYRLEERVRTRSDGSTWRAIDETLERPVLVRVFAPDQPHGAEIVDAARRAALVQDPRLQRVLAAGEERGAAYVVLERVPGRSLGELLAGGPLPAESARRIVGEAAQALDRASTRGLHHLRLRPTSLIVGQDGVVTVSGTAIDAAAEGEDALGPTPARRADAVGLVVVLYAALTGRWPGPERTGLPTAPRTGGRPVSPGDLVAGVPNDLDTLCSVTLGPYDDGPRSPGDLAADLAPWALAGPVSDVRGLQLTANRPQLKPRRIELPDPPAPKPTPAPAPAAAAAAAATAAEPFTPPFPGRRAPARGLRARTRSQVDARTSSTGELRAGQRDPTGKSSPTGPAAPPLFPSSPLATPIPPVGSPLAATPPAGAPVQPFPGAASVRRQRRKPKTEPKTEAKTQPVKAAPGPAPAPSKQPEPEPTAQPTTGKRPAAPEPAPQRERAREEKPAAVPRPEPASRPERVAHVEPLVLPGAVEPPAATTSQTQTPAAERSATSAAETERPPAESRRREQLGRLVRDRTPSDRPARTTKARHADVARTPGAPVAGPATAAAETVGRGKAAPASANGRHSDASPATWSGRRHAPPGYETGPITGVQALDILGAAARPVEPVGPFGPAAPLERPPRQQARLVVLILAALVLVLGIVAGMRAFSFDTAPLLTGTGTDNAASSSTATGAPSAGGTSSAPSSSSSTSTRVRIAGVSAIDPQGDGSENNGLAGNVVDGDRSTSWHSDHYNSPTFGGLKQGVGLVLDLGTKTAVTTVTITAPGDDGAVQLRASGSGRFAGSQLLTSGRIAGTGQVVLRPPSGTSTRYLVLWFTRVPQTDGGRRIVVDEVAVR